MPAAAARDFILGHMRIELAIVFEEKEGTVLSDGALKAIERAQTVVFHPGWKRIFEPRPVASSVRQIANPL